MNRLVDSQSPYLLQHADNPVDWWPWGQAAFDEAKRRNVPILLSVGYAACHWCHVMAHESFEDSETAADINDNFVAVKVDREERPDVDAVYMAAVQAATGQGGWPMTVFLTSEGEPFYFGTYYPPKPRHGMPSFRQVLRGVAEAWRTRREEVGEVAGRIVDSLDRRGPALEEIRPPSAEQQSAALVALTREYDAKNGGFGDSPKFPPSMVLEFLLRHHARTGSEAALEMAEHTCAALARGGIHDQLGGGFARYSVDAVWGVPHFEKMLYDNALLLRAYTHLWRANGSATARQVALRTADFLLRELRTPQGAFASSLDADSEDEHGQHVEGAYYVWTPEQLSDVLGPADASRAAALLGVTEEGTFERGASVLRWNADYAGDEVEEAWFDSVRNRLLAVRQQRPGPGRDDKVVTAWNGLTIAALAEAGALFERPDLVEAAAGAADLLVSVHLDGSRLRRTSREGQPGDNVGVLEDYGDLAEGFLALYAVTADPSWLTFAGVLLDVVLESFTDERGGFHDTADDAERLIHRPQDPTDNVTPSGWSAASGALLSYAAYTGSARHRDAAERGLGVVRSLGERVPRFLGWGLSVAEAALDGPREVALAGTEVLGPLHRVALLGTAPGAVIAVGGAEEDEGQEATVPLLTDRPPRDGLPTAYVCRGFVCAAPVTDAARLAETLGASAETVPSEAR